MTFENQSEKDNIAAGEYKYLSMIKSDYSEQEVDDLRKRKTELEAKLRLIHGQEFIDAVEELNVIKVILMGID